MTCVQYKSGAQLAKVCFVHTMFAGLGCLVMASPNLMKRLSQSWSTQPKDHDSSRPASDSRGLIWCSLCMQVGAAFGGMVGLNLMTWLPESWNIQPGVYAVVAATAVLAGVFRSSISLVSPYFYLRAFLA